MIAYADRETDDITLSLLKEMINEPNLQFKPQFEAWLRKQDKDSISAQQVGDVKEGTVVEFFGLSSETNNVCFVIDNSASMEERDRMKRAQDALWTSVKDLSILTRFNLVIFNSDVKTWQPVSLVATWRNRAVLQEYLFRVRAKGTTNTHDALEEAVDLYGTETIFMLTDGIPTVGVKNMNTIIRRITQRNQLKSNPVTIHTVAFNVPDGVAF